MKSHNRLTCCYGVILSDHGLQPKVPKYHGPTLSIIELTLNLLNFLSPFSAFLMTITTLRTHKYPFQLVCHYCHDITRM